MTEERSEKAKAFLEAPAHIDRVELDYAEYSDLVSRNTVLEDENAALRRELQEAKTKAYRNAAAFLRIQIKQERLVGKSVPERLDFCANRIQAMGAAPDTEAGEETKSV